MISLMHQRNAELSEQRDWGAKPLALRFGRVVNLILTEGL